MLVGALLVLVLLVLVLLVLVVGRRAAATGLAAIPSARQRPDDMDHFMTALVRWTTENGPVFKLHLGPAWVVLVADVHVAHQVLTQSHVREPPSATWRTAPTSLFWMDEAGWRRRRRALSTTVFSAARAKGRSDAALGAALDRLRSVLGDARGAVVNMSELLSLTVMDVLVRFLFGRGLDPQRDGAAVRAIGVLNRTFNEVNNTDSPSALDQHDRAHALLEAYVQGEDEAADVDETIALLLAGLETTSSTLQWLVYLTCTHRLPAAAHIDARYVDACVQETMRLYPAALIVPRVLQLPLTAHGVTIPAGTHVFVNLPAINQLESDWGPNPSAFVPERHLTSESRRRLVHNFGGGQHVCLGQRLAQAELDAIATVLLTEYHFSLADDAGDRPIEARCGFTLYPSRDLLVYL